MDGAERAIVGMGSHLGDREANLLLAAERIEDLHGVGLVLLSPAYASRPMGPATREFLNAAAVVETTLDPGALLDRLQEVERAGGRPAGHGKWGPRTIDLDVLAFGDVVRDGPPPVLPHPGLASRDFAIRPALDLVPGLADPATGRPLAGVLAGLPERWILSGPAPLPSRLEYAVLDHTSDVGLEVIAPDRAGLMAAAAMALADAIAPRGAFRETERVELGIESVDAAMALVDLLQEVVFLFESRLFLPLRARCRIEDGPGGTLLHADLHGGRADPGQVRMRPKAATHHGVEIGPGGGAWRARFYLDV